jgi:predicted nucleotidyltransferase
LYEGKLIYEIYNLVGNPKAIVLFGSYRKGDDTENSDIDIAIEVLGEKGLKIVNFGNIEQLGYRKNINLNLHIFSRNKIDLNLFSNIANGIVLDGFLEVNP